jgi:hypothetical protein
MPGYLRTYVENADRVAEKYGLSFEELDVFAILEKWRNAFVSK